MSKIEVGIGNRIIITVVESIKEVVVVLSRSRSVAYVVNLESALYAAKCSSLSFS